MLWFPSAEWNEWTGYLPSQRKRVQNQKNPRCLGCWTIWREFRLFLFKIHDFVLKFRLMRSTTTTILMLLHRHSKLISASYRIRWRWTHYKAIGLKLSSKINCSAFQVTKFNMFSLEGEERFSAIDRCLKKMTRGHRQNLIYLMKFLCDLEAKREETSLVLFFF